MNLVIAIIIAAFTSLLSMQWESLGRKKKKIVESIPEVLNYALPPSQSTLCWVIKSDCFTITNNGSEVWRDREPGRWDDGKQMFPVSVALGGREEPAVSGEEDTSTAAVRPAA